MSNKHGRLGRLYILRYYRFSSMCEEAYEVNSYSNSVLWSILNLKPKTPPCLPHTDCSWRNVSVYNSYVYILDDQNNR